tara:strand:- start:866 stop:1870 length:1005 start_codon:yes stop_codon:yes gene_type:complete
MEEVIKTRIRGMLLGAAIGDALGAPAEMKTPAQVKEKFGYIDGYIDMPKRKHQWTDDTQLTLAVANALIESKGFDMDMMVKHHIAAFDETVAGWGRSTKDSIARLKRGSSWKISALDGSTKSGYGNGILMKMSPFAAYAALDVVESVDLYSQVHYLIALTRMTHMSKLAVETSIFHLLALDGLLKREGRFVRSKWFQESKEAFCGWWFNIQPNALARLKFNGPSLWHELPKIQSVATEKPKSTDEELVKRFDNTYFALDTIRFCYALFLREPNKIDTILSAVNLGGDSDTNASIVASMMGALHGEKIFPQNWIEGLDIADQIRDTADQLYETFA